MGTKSLILTTMNITFILWPGIIISREPSPELTLSLIIIAPNYPNDIYKRLPILNIVFSNSTVLISCGFYTGALFTLTSPSSYILGGSGFYNGSLTKDFIIPTILVIGLITIVYVSLENVKDATVKIKHVNNVVPNYSYDSCIVYVLMVRRAYATKSEQLY